MERSDRSTSPTRDFYKKGSRSYKEARRERHRERCHPCEAYGHRSSSSWHDLPTPPLPTGRERLVSAAKAVVVSVVFFSAGIALGDVQLEF